MATEEMTRGFRTAEKADLAGLARDLSVLAFAVSDYPDAIDQVARGFLELSDLARHCGESKIHRASRAFSSILKRMDRTPEGDAPFILHTAITFLESIHLHGDRENAGVRP